MTDLTSTDTVTTPDFDIVVIGGGVNGAGIARDASGRGLSVLLCEKDDLASHTSSASTKLIHGGLRYLEHYDFMLVRHALQEREVLLKAAPHIIWPLRFILPHHQSLRPRWLIRLEYSDCWVQDSRLVVLNVMDAAERGCDVRVRTEVTDLIRHEGYWTIKLKDKNKGEQSSVTAKVIVNASGPWVDKTLDLDEEHDSRYSTRLVKGSHIVVPKIFDHPYTYIFQNPDNRILFAVPYEQDYTLLGTTDMEIEGEPGSIEIDNTEIEYICNAVSEYFDKPVSAENVIWSYSGVRPLYDDASANASKVTRDYKLDLDTRKDTPVLSVYGGKITTYRKLADQAVDMLTAHLDISKSDWTQSTHLPGGDIPDMDFDAYLVTSGKRHPWLNESLVYDYARNYGTCMEKILEGCNSMDDLGHHYGGLLYQKEVDYLIEHEWAQTAEDILWRRSKKGLQLSKQEAEQLQEFLTQKTA